MSLRRRCAAICGAVALAVVAACSDSPTDPSRFPLAFEITTGQTATVPGTTLQLRLDALGPCPPYASCLAGPRARLLASIDDGTPTDVPLAYPFEGPPIPQPVGGYTIAVRSFSEEADGRIRVFLLIDRQGARANGVAQVRAALHPVPS